MKRRSKRYKLIEKKKLKEKTSIDKIFDIIKETCTSKMNESIDIAVRINTKQSKGGDFNLRTVVKFPNGNGKKIRVAVLCEQEKVDEAKKSGADVAGSDDLLTNISNGKLNFDKLICTPGMMNKVGKFGKVLGPKGLMPNPKLGTVSNDIKKSISDLKTGLSEVKNDKDGNIGISIGRKNFTTKQILENLKYVFENLKKDKAPIFNAENIKNVYLSSTMGLSYKISFKEF